MDIRRLPLWESRNATIMTNDLIKTVIEDQGEITLELSNFNNHRGRVNALAIPYFRGLGSGVFSDANQDWYKSKQRTYNAGGIYITFPSKDEDRILACTSYWILRRYGSESTYGGVWRISEMKSRELGYRYKLTKIDLLLPNHPVLYTYLLIENTDEKPINYNIEVHSMLSSPFLESGCIISSSQAIYNAFRPNLREVALNRLKAGVRFNDLKHAPGVNGSNVDLTVVPPPTGTYDYILGTLNDDCSLGWTSVINPREMMIYLTLFPSTASSLPNEYIKSINIDFAFNYLGRMDTPWALYEGGTPQVFSLTTGFGLMNHNGLFEHSKESLLDVGEKRVLVYANALFSYDNPRLSNGFYSIEKANDSLIFRRTKSTVVLNIDHEFKAIRAIADSLLSNDSQ